jgi:TRAP-type C4-dicarboxylate transport system permease large subunit
MDPFAMLMIVVPILVPIIKSMGFNPIWFGVLTVIMMELGMITPPVGMNVFIMKGVAGNIPMYVIFKGLFPFVLAMAVCVAIIVAFPQIALLLPNTMH